MFSSYLLFSVSSAGISNDGGLLCGGFEDSSIHLWSLTPKKLVKPKTVTDISKVILAPGMIFHDSLGRIPTIMYIYASPIIISVQHSVYMFSYA